MNSWKWFHYQIECLHKGKGDYIYYICPKYTALDIFLYPCLLNRNLGVTTDLIWFDLPSTITLEMILKIIVVFTLI